MKICQFAIFSSLPIFVLVHYVSISYDTKISTIFLIYYAFKSTKVTGFAKRDVIHTVINIKKYVFELFNSL